MDENQINFTHRFCKQNEFSTIFFFTIFFFTIFFFLRFSGFNEKNLVVCVRQQKPLTKFEKMWNSPCIAIEDPFDLEHNLGAGLSRKSNHFYFNCNFKKCNKIKLSIIFLSFKFEFYWMFTNKFYTLHLLSTLSTHDYCNTYVAFTFYIILSFTLLIDLIYSISNSWQSIINCCTFWFQWTCTSRKHSWKAGITSELRCPCTWASWSWR